MLCIFQVRGSAVKKWRGMEWPHKILYEPSGCFGEDVQRV